MQPQSEFTSIVLQQHLLRARKGIGQREFHCAIFQSARLAAWSTVLAWGLLA